jgi:hypothetical protein
MKSPIFRDITPCSPLKVNQHVPPKPPLTFNGVDGVIFEKLEKSSIRILFNDAVCTAEIEVPIIFGR